MLVTLMVTAAIIQWQIVMRADVFDPEWLRIQHYLFLFHDYSAAFVFLFIVLAAMQSHIRRLGLTIVDLCGACPERVAVIAVFALALGAKFVYFDHPLSMDEYAAWFQATVFAEGRLHGQFSPELIDGLLPHPFHNYFLTVSRESGAIATSYWPGFALLLTPFVALGVPWLLNPILGGVSLVLVHRIAMQLFDDPRAAGFAMLFALSSPAVTVNAISYYSMSAHFVFNAAYALLLLTPTRRRAVVAGTIGSVALVLHNPVPHLLFSLSWMIWLAVSRERRPLIAWLVVGYLPIVFIIGLGWPLFLREIRANSDAVIALSQSEVGTFVDRWTHRLSSLFALPTLMLLRDRLSELAKLWIWSVPGVLVCVFSGLRERMREDARMLVLAASLALTFVGFLFVPFDQGHGWGARYLHSAWFAIPNLAAGGLSGPSTGKIKVSVTSSYLAGCAVLSLVLLTAMQAWNVHRFVEGHLAQVPESHVGEPKIVIISTTLGFYSQDLVQNDPFMRNSPLRLISRGRKFDAQLMAEQFPNMQLLHRDFRGSVWGYESSE